MKLEREDVSRNLREFIATGSGVLVGAPGVGKTHLLKEYCTRVLDQGGTCLYLPLDKLGANSEADLQAELELPTDLLSFLLSEAQATSSSHSPPVLVIDAFDAARSESAQQFVLRLIRSAQQRLTNSWRLVVSVRSYDARKSSALQALFPDTNIGVADAYRDPSIRCRHFFVPPLLAGEVQAAVASIPALPTVYENASDRFKALMTVPFNLWLAESLLQDQSTATSLSDVNSEVQLLGLFWFHRVENSPGSEARSTLLTRITERMVSERTLAVRVADVYPLNGASVWDALLSSEILDREAQRDRKRISFSHNILFDFAVSILLIDDEPAAAAAFLADDPSRPLFLRPSVDYFFTRLWDTAPTQFWDVLWYMFEAPEQHVRIYARLVPAMVMAREGRDIKQFQPLLDRVQGADAVGPQVLLNLLQTVRGVFNGQRDQLWAELLRRSATRLQPLFAWELGALTFDIYERAVEMGNAAVIEACGEVGRQLLSWALDARVKDPSPYADRVGAIWGVRLVARTFAQNVPASRALLAQVVADVVRPEFPIEYFSRLTDEVKHLWSVDPDFAVAVYEKAFSHREESDAKTSFGTPILPLTSTRRQDFSMCQFHLIEDYDKFLEQAPLPAIRAAVRALNEYIIERHVLRFLNPGYTVADVTTTFPFRGREASYVRDLCYSWDASLHRDQPVKLADELFAHLGQFALRGDAVRVDAALDVFAEEARAAFWWKRLLETGSKHPETLATRLFELVIAKPVLEYSETLHAAGTFIEEGTRHLTVAQRTVLEAQILQLPTQGKDEKTTSARTRWRNRLLSRVPTDLVVTDEARGLRAELEQKGQLEPNEPLVRYTMTSGTYTEDRFLEDKGVDTAREDNKRVRAITEPLNAFSTQWQNARPGVDAVSKILPLLRAAFEAVRVDTTSDPPIKHLAWTRITSAAQTVARADIDADGEAFALCKQILLVGLEIDMSTGSGPETGGSMDVELEPDTSADSQPETRDRDETYTFASWSPDPITNAAEALPWLGRLTHDQEILLAIEALSRHAEPSVRFLVVRELFRVLGTAPDVFWRIAEERATIDRNVVVQDSLVRTLGDVIGTNEERVVSVLTVIADRLFPSDKESEVLNTLTSLLVWLTLVREHAWAIGWTDAFLKDPVAHSHALQQAVFETVQRYVHPGETGRRTDVFKRAVGWLSRAIDAAAQAMDILERKAGAEFDEPTAELYKRLYGVLHEIVLRLQLSFRPISEDGTDAQRVEFYWHVKPLLQQIVRLGDSSKRTASIFAPTAHHFIEFLGDAVDQDPAGALHLAAAVASASEAAGYNLDSMAAKETVALAERIVTDYRSELRRPEVLSDLVRLLDLFAKAGWPDALRLLWRLDEVFR